ncbi:MAG: AAA domain-containing protein [Thermonemataceae bacterium]|nr:AAA domain-containing protein [Thermonemataceae bacterium]
MSAKEILALQIKALALEKQTDLVQYTEQMLRTPLQERKKQGNSWYPVHISESDFVLDKLRIKVQKSPQHPENHQFQIGMPVALFAQENPEKNRLIGTIQKIRQDEMSIILPTDELPDWVEEHKLGVDRLFDEQSYQAMELALKKVMEAENNRLAELREIFLGEHQAKFLDKNYTINIPSLNFSQCKALEKIDKAQDVAIIHGPPGTGKTTTLAEAIIFTLKTEKQVLLCTASNLALDWLVEKLVQKNINVVRIGNPTRVSENVLNNTLDYKISTNPQYKQIKTLRKQADEYWNLSKKYKRNFGAAEREQRKLLIQEAKNTSKEASEIEHFISKQILENAQVIAATLVGAEHQSIKHKNYFTVFIDEASQALDPAIWIPISKAQRVVLAGDHCQLPPTVKAIEAEKMGLGKTLLERLIEKQAEASIMLQIQYRMHQDIMQFSNQEFYGNKLMADESVKNRLLETEETAFSFLDTAGCGFEEEFDAEKQSILNKEEAHFLIKILDDLRIKFPQTQVAVISPYKAQVNYLKSLLESYSNLKVGTVDSFQGQESEVVFISLVRSNDKNEIGFLADTRRLNVALTRAQKRLFVIGDTATLAKNSFFQRFISYTEQIAAYKSAWEFLY